MCFLLRTVARGLQVSYCALMITTRKSIMRKRFEPRERRHNPSVGYPNHTCDIGPGPDERIYTYLSFTWIDIRM